MELRSTWKMVKNNPSQEYRRAVGVPSDPQMATLRRPTPFANTSITVWYGHLVHGFALKNAAALAYQNLRYLKMGESSMHGATKDVHRAQHRIASTNQHPAFH